MPTVRAIAREVVRSEWGIPDLAFDALWTALADVPRQTTPLANPDGLRVPALAAAGAFAEPPAIAVFIFTQAAQDLPNDVTWLELSTKITEIAATLGYKGIAKRITQPRHQDLAPTTPTETEDNSPAGYAMLYTDELPHGRSATKTDIDKIREHPEQYIIFIYHQKNLPSGTIGQLFLAGKPAHDARANSSQGHLTPIEYVILKHLLKHRLQDDLRMMPALIEHCWGKGEEAAELRELYDGDRLEYYEKTKSYRATISRLKNTLNKTIGVHLQSVNKRYSLSPWCSYCIIEEMTHSR